MVVLPELIFKWLFHSNAGNYEQRLQRPLLVAKRYFTAVIYSEYIYTYIHTRIAYR